MQEERVNGPWAYLLAGGGALLLLVAGKQKSRLRCLAPSVTRIHNERHGYQRSSPRGFLWLD